MAYDMGWIKKVRAAKGNTANTNTGAGQRTRRTSRSKSSGVTARGGGDVRRRVDASGGARQMTLAEKQAYATRKGIRYTPRASSGTVGVPSWTKKPLGTRNGVTTYQQPKTKTYYFKKNNIVYRYDDKNKRIYLLDNGLMSGGVQVPMNSLPQWVKNALW